MQLAPGTVIGGKYRLEKSLARGGMGSVWVARHEALDVDVAVKVIAPELMASETAVVRFRREARASAQLRSPNVVQILDYGVDAGTPYMVMELLEGTDLAKLLEKEGKLTLPRAKQILTQVLKALKLAHDVRIVHRDLKPANIFLSMHGDDEVVKILDFGIAKTLQPAGGLSHTSSTTLVGSPLYMSPEQSRGDAVDARSDLWSAAVVLFEILTGAPPFRGRGLGDVFAQICNGETPKASERGVEVPGLDEFFAKALAKEPEHRFPTARALSEAFEAVGRSAPTAPLDVEPKRTLAREGDTVDIAKPGSLSAAARDVRVETVAEAPNVSTSETRDLTILEVQRIDESRAPRWWIVPFAIGGVVLGVLGWFVTTREPHSGTVATEPSTATTAPMLELDVPAQAKPVAPSTAMASATASASVSASAPLNGAPKPLPRALPLPSSPSTSKPTGTGTTSPAEELFAPRPNNR